jgi:hypothetical protein
MDKKGPDFSKFFRHFTYLCYCSHKTFLFQIFGNQMFSKLHIFFTSMFPAKQFNSAGVDFFLFVLTFPQNLSKILQDFVTLSTRKK